MESFKALKIPVSKKNTAKEEPKTSWFETLAKLKRMNTMNQINPNKSDPEKEDKKIEKKATDPQEDTYEMKKKRELAKMLIREFTKAESEKDASEPEREANRKKIEDILKATTTIQQAPPLAVARWNKLKKLTSYEIKRQSAEN